MAVEWSLVLFSLLAGGGGCAFTYLAMSDFLTKSKTGRLQITIVSFIVVVIGGFCSVTHLASPENVMAALWNIGSLSGISVELILIGITCVLMAVYFLLVKQEASETAIKAVGAAGGVFGLLLAFFTGHGYVIESQALWNSELLPIAYLGTSLALGAFLYLVCAEVCKVEPEALSKMVLPVGIGAILGVVTVLVYVLTAGFGQGTTEAAPVWGGLALCGALVAAACGVVVMVRKNAANSLAIPCVGLVAALVGALAMRGFMWAVGSGFLSLFDVALTTRVFGL